MKKIISGIYQIKNTTNGKIYIGSSKNIAKRWNNHKYFAKSDDRELYKDIRAIGLENFELSILEECNEDELRSREQYYINSLNPYYNIVKADTGIGIKQSEDFNEYHRLYLATQEDYKKSHTKYCSEWNKNHREYFRKYYREHKKNV